jgi:hypothetical protein
MIVEETSIVILLLCHIVTLVCDVACQTGQTVDVVLCGYTTVLLFTHSSRAPCSSHFQRQNSPSISTSPTSPVFKVRPVFLTASLSLHIRPQRSCQWNRNNVLFVLMCRSTVQNTVQVILSERISVQVIKITGIKFLLETV